MKPCRDSRRSLLSKVYSWLTDCLYAATLPPFKLYAQLSRPSLASARQRFGYYPPKWRPRGDRRPTIWLHAASVGEVTVAAAVVGQLTEVMPTFRLIVSTVTAHGQAVAQHKLGHRARCILAPLDFTAVVRRATAFFDPDVLVCLETEIWPNWLRCARQQGVRIAMVNGRISVRSVHSYRRVKPLIRDTLSHVDIFSMIHRDDARRLIRLGAKADRVVVNGNAKFDLATTQSVATTVDRMRRRYGLDDRQPVFVAGSTRGQEHDWMLKVFHRVLKQFPDAVMILAPRHIQKAPQIAAKAVSRGLPCQLKTELTRHRRSAPVVILDTMGELHDTYSIADIVFCGGSLVPLGGQNILEPAVWSKPVLFGPSLEDFKEAKDLLERYGGGIRVENDGQLADRVIELMQDPATARAVGRSARLAVEANEGAARKHALVIRELATA
jgi:3-deoxy-D-manno-octulosonic-acid transferase